MPSEKTGVTRPLSATHSLLSGPGLSVLIPCLAFGVLLQLRSAGRGYPGPLNSGPPSCPYPAPHSPNPLLHAASADRYVPNWHSVPGRRHPRPRAATRKLSAASH